MPWDDKKLEKDITKRLQDNMKKINPLAKPVDFQEQIAKAIAKALTNHFKISRIRGISPAPMSTGIGNGITVNAKIMVSNAVLLMMGFTGGKEGIATKAFFDAIMTPIEKHMKKAIITSESGFGGQGGPLSDITMASLAPLILAQLPPNIQASMATSPQGLFFINALAGGISAGMAQAIPALVPVGSVPPPPGLLIGKIG